MPEDRGYLDRKTARIDNLIAEKQNFINLLKEKRQALISHVVTKGLDPKVKMKDSGIEWIGEVPEHWFVGKLSNFCESISTGPFGTALNASEYIEDGVPVINPSHISETGCIPDRQVTVDPQTAERLALWRLRPGDLITARRGELGRAAVVEEHEDGWICGTGSIRITTKKNALVPYYLSIVFQSHQLRSWLQLSSVGSTMPNLSETLVKAIPLVLPPSVQEQRAIVSEIRARTAAVDRLVQETESSIALLYEHRTALISAAVTGKIDVRDH
jgi:type I restriction enzyme S subunit